MVRRQWAFILLVLFFCNACEGLGFPPRIPSDSNSGDRLDSGVLEDTQKVPDTPGAYKDGSSIPDINADMGGGVDMVIVPDISADKGGGVDMVIVPDISADKGSKPTGKFVGNITQSGNIPSDFAKYWNQITCENAGKWGSVERNRNSMNWSGVDRAYNFARQHGMPYKHHTFVWGSQAPGWINGLPQNEQKAEVEEWIRLYCQRYPDTELIDVVNEPDHATPSFAGALGGSGSSGHDWIIWSFQTARRYCPNSILILNDYNVLRWHTNNFISIANKLKSRGLLDAVGVQAHGLESQSLSELQSNLNKVAAIGVPIYISEYDIDIGNDNQQRQIMKDQFTLFYNSSSVAGITIWGYIYGQTWRSNTGLIRNGSPRPAMTWLMDFLKR